MTEEDIRLCGIESFGARRKLSLAIRTEAARREGADKPGAAGGDAQQLVQVAQAVQQPVPLYIVQELEPPDRRYDIRALIDDPTLYANCVKGDNLGRIRMVKKVVTKCAETIWARKEYATADDKETLAKAITREFPIFRDVTVAEEHGHCAFFNRRTHSGFIHSRVKKLQEKLPPGQKARAGQKRRGDNLVVPERRAVGQAVAQLNSPSEEELRIAFEAEHEAKQKVLEMAYLGEGSPDRIRKLWTETHEYRRSWLQKKNPYVSEFLKEYPKLPKIPDMLDMDLELISPGAKAAFARNWSAIVDGAEKLDENLPEHLQNMDLSKDETAMMKLTMALHQTNARKKGKKAVSCSKMETCNFVMQNHDILNPSNQKGTQPLLRRDPRNGQYLITAEPGAEAFLCDTDFVAAFCRLYAVFWSMNLQYPEVIEDYYKFIEYLFGMRDTLASKQAMVMAKCKALGNEDEED